MSVFQMVESMQMPTLPDVPEAGLNFEAHAYFEQDTPVRRFIDARLVWVGDRGLEAPATDVAPRIEMVQLRMRARFRGVKVPPWYGNLHLLVEWRDAGTERWNREPARWPVEFALAPPSVVPPAH